MPRLILHIGDGKTGSSFLQHAFAVHRHELRSMGVHYPDDPSLEVAARGIPTGGNGKQLARMLNRPLADVSHELESYLAKIQAEDGIDLLVSSEDMQIVRRANLQHFNQLAKNAGYTLFVIYYVRSVTGRAYSGYLQRVKRHRETRSFADYAQTYRYLPPCVVPILEETLAPENLLIRNFDCARSDLFSDFARAVLPAPCADLVVEDRIVNRSLAPSQVVYMRELNRHLTNDTQATAAGHALMEASAPNGDRIIVTQQEADILARLNLEGLDRVNRHLGESECVQLLGPNEQIGLLPTTVPSDIERNSIILLASLFRRLYPDR